MADAAATPIALIPSLNANKLAQLLVCVLVCVSLRISSNVLMFKRSQVQIEQKVAGYFDLNYTLFFINTPFFGAEAHCV